jgi:hypothetical protein
MGDFCVLLHQLADLGSQFVKFGVEGEGGSGHVEA